MTIQIRYKTEITSPREDVFGRVARATAKMPYLVGFGGGVLVALLAFTQAPGVLKTAPLEAVFLALFVVIAWTVLFGFMRTFFANLALVDREIVRTIMYDGTEFVFDDGQDKTTIINPIFKLVTLPVPQGVLDDERAAAQPWDVWVTVGTNDEAPFVLKTKVAAAEAADYPAASEDVQANPHEHLPTHVASPLLVLARNA